MLVKGVTIWASSAAALASEISPVLCVRPKRGRADEAATLLTLLCYTLMLRACDTLMLLAHSCFLAPHCYTLALPCALRGDMAQGRHAQQQGH
jgi:hypothetical protein